jgi:hypothetical protein
MAARTSYALPAMLYMLFIGTAFSPEVQPVLAKAFGARPFGYPVTVVVAIAQAIVLFPFVFALHHFMLIAERAAAEGHGVGKFGLLAYAASASKRHPELRRSQLIAVAGLVWFVLVCTVWIAYADAKGF